MSAIVDLVFFVPPASGGLPPATGWTQVTDPFPGGSGTAGSAIYADASGVYVGGDAGIYKSVDGGVSWTNIGDPSWATAGHPQVNSISASVLGELVCGVGKDATSHGLNLGAWKLSGGVWARCTNTAGGYIDASNVVVITRALDASGNMFAVTGFNGDVWKSTDNGTSWTKIAAAVGGTGGVSDGALNFVVWNPSDGSLLTGGEIHAIYRSTDGGVTWVNFGLDVAAGYKDNMLTGVCNNLNEPLIVRDFGSTGIQRYTGGAWVTSSAGVDAYATVRGILVNPTTGTCYCSDSRNSGPAGGTVFKSTDNGANWVEWATGINTTLPMRGIARAPNGVLWVISKASTALNVYKTNGVAP